MDAEDKQKAEAAAKRAAKRERLSKQRAEAIRVQEEKAAAEAAAAAAAGQAADRADAAEAEEVSLCACAAAGGSSGRARRQRELLQSTRTFGHIGNAESKLPLQEQSQSSVGLGHQDALSHIYTHDTRSNQLARCRLRGTQLSAQRALRRQGQMEPPMEPAWSHTA